MYIELKKIYDRVGTPNDTKGIRQGKSGKCSDNCKVIEAIEAIEALEQTRERKKSKNQKN